MTYVLLTDITHDKYMNPSPQYLIYLPEIAGIGGSYKNNEYPIFNGIEVTIHSDPYNHNTSMLIGTLNNEFKDTIVKNTSYKRIQNIDNAEVYVRNTTIRKFGYEGSHVDIKFFKGKQTFSMNADFLNTKEYATLFTRILHSIKFTETDICQKYRDLSGMQRLHMNEYDISLYYPIIWTYRKASQPVFSSPNLSVVIPGGLNEGGLITMFVDKYDANQPLTNWYDNADYIISEKKKTQIDGHTAVIYSFQSPPNKAAALIANNDKLYRFEVEYGEREREDVLKIFSTMIRYIKFTNQ
ncbi:MAG: hypothetical protein RI947_107 [Candidatus Parcubacteria bacterium]